MLWEVGGNTNGIGLVYGALNTLTLQVRQADAASQTFSVSAPLTPLQIAGGEVELIWTIDADIDGTNSRLSLYIDGALADTNTGDINNDWTGSNQEGFDQAAQQLGGFPASASDQAFASGTITTGTNPHQGLEFYADTLFIPEPGSLALLTLAASAVLLVRRRW